MKYRRSTAPALSLDTIYFGFSARHWQQAEVGRPITVKTLLSVCEVFALPIERLVSGLDKGMHPEEPQSIPTRGRRRHR
jgi:hypothetical protein